MTRRAVILALVFGGCAGEGGDKGLGGNEDPGEAFSGEMTCNDPTTPGGTVNLDVVDICVVHEAEGVLDLSILGGDGANFMTVRINGFDGAGSYTTGETTNNEDTFVNIRGTVDEETALDVTSAGDETCPSHACTITVTTADVWNTRANGRLAGTVACPQMGYGTTDCFECSGLGAVPFDVSTCEFSE